MSLFVCSKCNHLDNTALSPNYWGRCLDGKPGRCTRCITRKWHGRFPRTKYNAELHGPAGKGGRLGGDITLAGKAAP